VDSGYVIPVKGGTVVSGLTYQNGLYKAALGSSTPVLIPNSNTDGTCNSTQITEDGQWVLYNAGGPRLIRIDGQFKTKVPEVSHGSEGCCTFWWRAPSGKLEVVYRASDNLTVHAVPVTFGAAAPTFGADHIILQLTAVPAPGIMEFTMGVSGNHMFVRVDDAHYGPKMITLPASGAAATSADFYVPAGTDFPSWGCMTTISHNGSLCAFNTGFDQWCGCLANEFCLLRHKSFVLLPFQEKTAPSVGWQAVLLKTMAVSVNWAPRKYLYLNPADTTHGLSALSSNFWSDFKNWSYTNDSSYIVGDGTYLPNASSPPDSNMADSGTIWLVHYPTNTWTRILRPLAPVGRNTFLGFPAVWIDKSTSVAPLPGNRLGQGHRSDPWQGNSYMVDIRGRRIVSNVQAAPKLPAGVYYAVARDGVMKRIFVCQ
jgi:hypothetical protein